jgi:S-adenosylmethionine-dependent methyltransferase
MMVSPATFDDNVEKWTQEQQAPWSVLKYKIIQANLRRHLSPDSPLRILDVGGGNGLDALPLARAGHDVTIVDYSREMLEDGRQRVEMAGLQQKVALHCADIRQIPALFAHQTFDVVLCHNVLQYVADIRELIQAVLTPLKAGGLLSLVSVNRYSVPYRAAFFQGDLESAHALLDQRQVDAIVFGAPMTLYTGEEIRAMLPEVGCAFDRYYGVRCICDYWGDTERKTDPAIMAPLEQLEMALTDRHPYNLLARYFQVIGHKL